MKKTVCVLTALVLFLSIAGVATAAPIRLTKSTRYDRNPDILKAKDGRYWLFFTRGRNPVGVRGVSGYDPDQDSYDIYYKVAGTVGGLKTATERLVPWSNSVTTNTQRDIAVVQDAAGVIWLFAASGYATSSDPRIFYYQYRKATGWTGPTGIDGTGYAGHIDAVVVGGTIWVFFDAWAYTLQQMSWDGAAWSTPTILLEKATLGKAIYESGRFYLVWSYVDMDLGEYGKYIGLLTSLDGPTWTNIGQIAAWPGATNWDPVLVKFAGTAKFRLYWAPDTGATGQIIALSTSKTPLVPGSWSAPLQVTRADYGANSWWDFWPNASKVPKCIFYSSERNNTGTAMTNSRIWMIWQ